MIAILSGVLNNVMTKPEILSGLSLIDQAQAAYAENRIDKAKELLGRLLSIADKQMLFLMLNDYNRYLKSLLDNSSDNV